MHAIFEGIRAMSKLKFARSTGLLLLALIATSAFAAPPEGYRFLPLTEAAQEAGASGKPMLLYFGRYGCTTCRKMHAEVFTDPAVHERYDADFVLAYVDTESGNRIKLANGERITEMQFASRNRILGTPTFVFFSPQQKPLFKKAGFQSIEQMQRYADYIVDGHFEQMPLADYLAQQ
jgi:thioredoxin-related protein